LIRGLVAALGIGWTTLGHALVVDVQEFSVTRNGALWFSDSFADGNAPPNAPDFVIGAPASYSVFGAIPSNSEASGRLRLDSANGAVTQSATEQPRLRVHATLLSDSSSAPADLGAGLKSDDTISVAGIFSLPTPSGSLASSYGIQVGDFSSVSDPLHRLVQTSVDFDHFRNETLVRFSLFDFDFNVWATFGSILVVPPAGADAILLGINRPDATSKEFFGSFAYVTAGVVGPLTAVGVPFELFQHEQFVQARMFVEVSPVPEPETYALMLAGLGLVGLAARRRKRA